jgi:hypothetical protein
MKQLSYFYTVTYFKTTTLLSLVLTMLFSACIDDNPKKEDVAELITQVTLTFTPTDGGDAVMVTANDPDGEGVQDLIVDGPINLATNKTYTLDIKLTNGLAEITDPAYDITAEVGAESDEHMFFFNWTNTIFFDPTGDGNMDNRKDDVNYRDEDNNGLPLGLKTEWKTEMVPATGMFRVMLKHQPELKSATSESTTGETDLYISFAIAIL